ncbi:MAG: hypothetical protein Q9168_007920 [Polycauliona sp. 1 TL-2023]
MPQEIMPPSGTSQSQPGGSDKAPNHQFPNIEAAEQALFYHRYQERKQRRTVKTANLIERRALLEISIREHENQIQALLRRNVEMKCGLKTSFAQYYKDGHFDGSWFMKVERMQASQYQLEVYILAAGEVSKQCEELGLQIQGHQEGVGNKIKQIESISRQIGAVEEQEAHDRKYPEESGYPG